MNNKNKRAALRYIIISIVAILLIVMLWLIIYRQQNKPVEVSYDAMMKQIQEGQVTGIYVSGGYTVYYTTDADLTKFNKNPASYAKNFAQVPSRTSFADDLKAAGYTKIVTYDNPSNTTPWTSYIVPVLGLLVMVGMAFFLFRQVGGQNKQALSFGKTRARLTRNVKVRFSDVAGAEEEKEELQEIVEFLKSPEKFKKLGARVPKGVLLVGPPGTGKTLFAKAVAGESNVNFFSISGSDFVEMFVGTGAARVRDLFDQAQKNKPCIVFIDEIDAVGRQRGAGLGGGNDEREQTLNQLLVQMDGFEESTDIIVMAATNRADVLDPALLRPGRFDRQITISNPDVRGREAILKVHARNKHIDPNIKLDDIAQRTPGFSGADLENLLNEAALLAARENRKVINRSDIDEASDRVMMGPAKRSKQYTEHERRLVAIHESGHAVIGLRLEDASVVQKITIVPRGQAGGYNLMMPKEETYFHTKKQLLETITGYLGGRVAEELVFNDVSTGASNDFENATKIARAMVTEYGMSSLGPIQYEQPNGSIFLGRDYLKDKNFSDQVALEIDKEVRMIIEKCYADAKKVIEENLTLLNNIADYLLKLETLTKSDIDEINQTGHLSWYDEKMNPTVDVENKSEEIKDEADVKEDTQVEAKEEAKTEEVKEDNNDSNTSNSDENNETR